MLVDDLFSLLNTTLRPLEFLPDEGEEYRDPPLDVLRFDRRSVRLSRVPIIGRSLAVVATVRQPMDLAFTTEGVQGLIGRVGMAVNNRYPPWPRGPGVAVGLSILVVTPEPIRPEDERVLAESLRPVRRLRAVPLGLFRLNLGQEAFAFSLARGPEGLFPEPTALADTFTETFRRFLPNLEL